MRDKNSLAFVTNVFSRAHSFGFRITFVAKSAIGIFEKTKICQFFIASTATKTFRMPIRIHGFDDSSDDEFATFATAGSEQYLKIVFAIFSSFEFVKRTIRKRSETLRAPTENTLMLLRWKGSFVRNTLFVRNLTRNIEDAKVHLLNWQFFHGVQIHLRNESKPCCSSASWHYNKKKKIQI